MAFPGNGDLDEYDFGPLNPICPIYSIFWTDSKPLVQHPLKSLHFSLARWVWTSETFPFWCQKRQGHWRWHICLVARDPLFCCHHSVPCWHQTHWIWRSFPFYHGLAMRYHSRWRGCFRNLDASHGKWCDWHAQGQSYWACWQVSIVRTHRNCCRFLRLANHFLQCACRSPCHWCHLKLETLSRQVGMGLSNDMTCRQKNCVQRQSRPWDIWFSYARLLYQNSAQQERRLAALTWQARDGQCRLVVW